jgi:hypothetical protein
MLQRCGRNFAGTHRTAEHGEQFENVVSELTHAAKHVTSENLLVTMRVGHLDAMSNVVGAAPLFVHRSDDAKSSSAVEPNDEDISGAAALCNELPDDQRCIADQFDLDSALADDTTTAIRLRLKRNSRWRNSGMIGGETHDCTSDALDSPLMRKRAAGVVSGEPNAARAEKSATATLNLQLGCSGARKLFLACSTRPVR